MPCPRSHIYKEVELELDNQLYYEVITGIKIQEDYL